MRTMLGDWDAGAQVEATGEGAVWVERAQVEALNAAVRKAGERKLALMTAIKDIKKGARRHATLFLMNCQSSISLRWAEHASCAVSLSACALQASMWPSGSPRNWTYRLRTWPHPCRSCSCCGLRAACWRAHTALLTVNCTDNHFQETSFKGLCWRVPAILLARSGLVKKAGTAAVAQRAPDRDSCALQKGLQTSNAAAGVAAAEVKAAERLLKHAARLHARQEAESARRLRRAAASISAQRAKNEAAMQARR